MKFGILSYKRSRNFGDQIQTLAAKQYLPQVDRSLDRDFLTEYDSPEDIKLIMNGWFMAKPQHWPPPTSIKPLLISFHITHDYGANKKLFSDHAMVFFNENAPIGCRDYYTMELLRSKGIDAYYSGCLTLTLRKQFPDAPKTDSIYMVDVLYKIGASSTDWRGKAKRNWLIKQIIPENILSQAETISQDAPKHSSEEIKLSLAESALEKYANAKLVITSRIHCALPCIAFNTPVIFIDGGLDEATDTTRLKGVVEYFNSYTIDVLSAQYKGFLKEIFSNNDFNNPLNIDWDSPPENPQTHHETAEKLRKTCIDFINNAQL